MEKLNLSLMDMGRMMLEVVRVFKKRTENQPFGEIRLSAEQVSMLHALSKHEEEVIQQDLAEMMGKDRSAILRLIDSLEEKGLVRRVASQDDRRKNYLMVSKLGMRVVDHYMGIVSVLMMDLQEGLTPEEIGVFHKVISSIRENAINLNGQKMFS